MAVDRLSRSCDQPESGTTNHQSFHHPNEEHAGPRPSVGRVAVQRSFWLRCRSAAAEQATSRETQAHSTWLSAAAAEGFRNQATEERSFSLPRKLVVRLVRDKVRKTQSRVRSFSQNSI